MICVESRRLWKTAPTYKTQPAHQWILCLLEKALLIGLT